MNRGRRQLRVSSLDGAGPALLLEFLLLGLVGGEVGLELALVLLALSLGAQVREDGVEAGSEGVLLVGGLVGRSHVDWCVDCGKVSLKLGSFVYYLARRRWLLS